MEPKESNKFLDHLRRDRQELDRRIEELTERRKRIDQAIHEISAQAYALSENIELNQKNRRYVVITGILRQILQEAYKQKRRGLKTRDLYNQLSEKYGSIEYSTFRGYLHRLKNERQIFQRGRSAPWQLSDTANKNGEVKR